MMHAVMAPSAHQQLAPVRTRQGAATPPPLGCPREHVRGFRGGRSSRCMQSCATTRSSWHIFPVGTSHFGNEGDERDTLSCLAG